MVQQRHGAGSAVPAVRLVEDSEERFFNGAEKLLAHRAVDVIEGVEGKRRRVVCVSDGRCFRAGRAGQDDGRCTRIERGDDSCGREGVIDGGVEGEAQVVEGAAAEVCGDGHSVGVQKLVHRVQHGVCRLLVNQRDVRFLEALDKLVDGGGCHGGGLIN